MPPFWPFKRSKQSEETVVESAPEPIVYRKGQDVHSDKHSTTIQRDEDAYNDALALFGGGDTIVAVSSNVAEDYDGVSEAPLETSPSPSEDYEWVHHTDGYHYKKKSDGQFDPTPYLKNDDGTYTAYA